MSMFFEMSRVYRDIVEEVGRMLENESDVDLKKIHDLKVMWLNNLTERIENHGDVVQEPIVESASCSDSEDDIKGKNTQNFMMCLYDKVTKSKYKWRVNFKQGFLNIGNSDYAFSLGQGDLDW
ncbi:RNA polymerase II transcription initiation factor TFIIA, large chain [Trachipleistophora hominis]|uniref:RNA polymerase II transcription initiation factor TFIIA, large chain n=1 Tax=Trachipleistophora hominis TaxID=72359 RepID=L7JYV2_TRAHO|nr:RNA polymerase II transcription initiation factor TFIIA, large chain [Trachipleistophora hominis]